MNNWEQDGIVLSARAHGENGVILSILTPEQGRSVGYVPGGQSRSKRATLETGSLVHARKTARVSDQMGTFVIEPVRCPAGMMMTEPLRLSAVLSACALCSSALPEGEVHPALYHGLLALMEQLQGDLWGPAYVAWEVAFMKEMGFALDFSRCAAGGDATDLQYMSPKSGVSVSYEHGLLYRTKLLSLPHFFRPNPDLDELGTIADVLTGLRLTGYFLEHWVYNHHRTGVPEARVQLMARAERVVADLCGAAA